MIGFGTIVMTGAAGVSTGAAVLLSIPKDSSGGMPRLVRVTATASAYVRASASGVSAAAGDTLVQPGDSAVMDVTGCYFLSVMSLGGSANVSVAPTEYGRWDYMGSVAVAALFSPASNFSSGQQGLWYDPSSFANLFQDSAGTTPATTVGQPTGLMLDRRLGLVPGPELVTNGGFAADLAGWSNNISATWDAGAALLSATTANATLAQSCATVIGKTYAVTFDFVAGNGGNSLIYIGTTPGDGSNRAVGMSVVGTGKTTVFTATATTSWITLLVSYPGVSITGKWDNISVKLLDGNHISQPTAAARPLVGTASGVQYLTFDGLDDSMSTGAITLTADMDCFIAVRRSTSANAVLIYDVAGNNAGGICEAAPALASGQTSGTFAVNGVDVPGAATTTRSQLNTAVTVGGWCVVELRNINIAIWTKVSFGGFGSGYNLNGDIAGVILCPAGDATARQKNRQFLGNKVGLVLP